MEVNIYIKKKWIGNFSGDGKAIAKIEYQSKKGNTHIKYIGESVIEGTRNKLELKICVAALRALKKKCSVNIFTDSGYIKSTLKNNWLTDWKKNDWKRKNGTSIANVKEWKLLSILLEMHEVSIKDYNKKYDEELKEILEGKEK